MESFDSTEISLSTSTTSPLSSSTALSASATTAWANIDCFSLCEVSSLQTINNVPALLPSTPQSLNDNSNAFDSSVLKDFPSSPLSNVIQSEMPFWTNTGTCPSNSSLQNFLPFNESPIYAHYVSPEHNYSIFQGELTQSLSDLPYPFFGWHDPSSIAHPCTSTIQVHEIPLNQEFDYIPISDLTIENDSYPPSPCLSPTKTYPTFQKRFLNYSNNNVSEILPIKRRCAKNMLPSFALLHSPEALNYDNVTTNTCQGYQPYRYTASPSFQSQRAEQSDVFLISNDTCNSPTTLAIVPGRPNIVHRTQTTTSTENGLIRPSRFRRKRRRLRDALHQSSFHKWHSDNKNNKCVENVPGVYFDRRKKGFRVRFQNVYVGWVSLSRYPTYEDAYFVAKKIWDDAVREVVESQDKHAAINAGISLQIQSRLKSKNPGGRPRTVSKLSPSVDAKIAAVVESAKHNTYI